MDLRECECEAALERGGVEGAEEREISKMADASERKGSHVVMDEIGGKSAGEWENG